MKIIIHNGRTKRELVAPFAICGSRTDLERLRDQLTSQLATAEGVYGWLIEITPALPPLADTPRKWDE